MKKGITPKGLQIILVVLVAGLGVVAYLYMFGPTAQQWDNIALARGYAEIKTNEIEGREEFEHITVSEFTGLNGSVLVSGILHEANEGELKAIIYTDELPTEVAWKVRLLDSESWNDFITYEQSNQ
jgi:hypothetical protein